MFKQLCTAAFGLLIAGAAPGQQAQPALPTVEVQAGIHLIKAEVADSPDSRQMGLMYRKRLGSNEGMLFVFPEASGQCFWMKNTVLPLSIAFIADDGHIVNIADMKPLDEASHCSKQAVRFALEMEQGWFDKRGIKAGFRLTQARLFAAGAARAR